jgi:hypothetical protein
MELGKGAQIEAGSIRGGRVCAGQREAVKDSDTMGRGRSEVMYQTKLLHIQTGQ